MNLGNLRTLCRLTIPEAKTNRLDNTNLDLFINEVVKDLNLRLMILKQDDKFTVTADKYRYDLSNSSETVDRFTKIDKSGLWWNAGDATDTDWRNLYPKTLKWLDDNFPRWRDQGSSDPQYYAKHGRYLYLYPTPDTTLTNGFWLYFIENTIPMDDDSKYPFGYDVELGEYATLTDVIIKGVEWWIMPIVGKKELQTSIFQEYLALIEIKKKELRKEPHILSDKDAKIRIPHVC